MNKTALITGITGQDGAYLADFLLEKGYVVHGIKRRASLFNTDRVDHLYQDPHVTDRRFILHYGDMTDASNLIRILQQVQPDEVYNLAAQSHVQVSFESPEYTADTPDGDHPVLSPVPLCLCQAVCLLDHRQLPGSLWHLRVQWDLVQP